MASELGLTEEQIRRTESLFKSMESQAKLIGAPLVEEERKLDQLFAEKKITSESLNQSLKRISTLQEQLRRTHLEAHLAQTEILTPEQISKYKILRGYTGHQETEGHMDHKHG